MTKLRPADSQLQLELPLPEETPQASFGSGHAAYGAPMWEDVMYGRNTNMSDMVWLFNVRPLRGEQESWIENTLDYLV